MSSRMQERGRIQKKDQGFIPSVGLMRKCRSCDLQKDNDSKRVIHRNDNHTAGSFGYSPGFFSQSNVKEEPFIYSPTIQYDISVVPVQLQKKLEISNPGDPYEQEADRVADLVMRMPDPGIFQRNNPEEKNCPLDKEKKKRFVQLKEDTSAKGRQDAPDNLLGNLGPGQPLDRSTRDFMEPRFGYDFSQVRVHTDQKVADSAKEVNAFAYTVGRNVVFGEGRYAPTMLTGQKLLAHELTHVVQQMRRGALHFDYGGCCGIITDISNSGCDVHHQLLQRDRGRNEKKADKPWIPMPVFDEFDPAVIVPDIPGMPGLIKGQKVPLSLLRKVLDTLRGNKQTSSSSKPICDLIPDMEIAELGPFAGKCCKKYKRDEQDCCTWRSLSIKDMRCCRKDEVLLPDNSCFKPQRAPATPATDVSQAAKPQATPPFPRLELKEPPIRFGTIESTTIDKFVLNSATIPAIYEKELDHMAALLKIYKDAEIHIEGHTDSSSTEEYNQALSEKRANAVKKDLVKRGIKTANMTVVGFGETQLRFPAESNAEEKAANRRVEVWFYTPPSKTLGDDLKLQVL